MLLFLFQIGIQAMDGSGRTDGTTVTVVVQRNSPVIVTPQNSAIPAISDTTSISHTQNVNVPFYSFTVTDADSVSTENEKTKIVL